MLESKEESLLSRLSRKLSPLRAPASVAKPRRLSLVMLLVGGVATIAGFAGGAEAAGSGAPGSWSLVGAGIRSVSGQIGIARTSDGVLHVIWSRGGAGTPWGLFDSAISAAGRVGSPGVIASGWSRIDDPAAVAHDQTLTVVFPGTKTDASGDPTEGLDVAWGGPGGWQIGTAAIYANGFAGSTVPALAERSDGSLLEAWSNDGNVVVHSGVDPGTALSSSFGRGGNVALASSGASAWVAWCSSDSPSGVFVRDIGLTGDPAGEPKRLTLTARCPAATRLPFVAREQGGAYVAVVEGTVIGVWQAGTNVISFTDAAHDDGIKQQVALAAAPDGRLWVGWRDADSGLLRFRRSDRTAAHWGRIVSVAPPSGQDGVVNLDLASQADRVDVIARTEKAGEVSLFHTQVLPGLDVSDIPRAGGVTIVVLDAGDPVPGAAVHIGKHLFHTLKDGTVALALAPGRYTVTASKKGYVGQTKTVRIKPAK